MIQANPITGALTSHADGRILARHYWVYGIDTCEEYDPSTWRDGQSGFNALGCLQANDYPFTKFYLLGDGCSTPPLYLSLAGSYSGEEIVCHPKYKRLSCTYSEPPSGVVAVPYNDSWKIECGYEDLLFVTESESTAAFSHITNVEGEVFCFKTHYSTGFDTFAHSCHIDSSYNYAFYQQIATPTYYSELWEDWMYMTVPGYNGAWADLYRCESDDIGLECPDPRWPHITVGSDTLCCIDADANFHVVAYVEFGRPPLYIPQITCRLEGVASGLSIDDETCLPYGTVVVPFYNGYDEYVGSHTFTIEIKLCSER